MNVLLKGIVSRPASNLQNTVLFQVFATIQGHQDAFRYKILVHDAGAFKGITRKESSA